MKAHTRIYLEAVYGDTIEQAVCEICVLKHDAETPAVDVHHIGGRRAGGSKLLDRIEKLAGLCRHHHNECEDGTYTEDEQLEMHQQFLDLNNVEYDEEILYASLHELTQMQKHGKL